MSEWRPIETLPAGRIVVDLWADGQRWTDMEWQVTSPRNPNGAWIREGDYWWNAIDIEPTHWMPLPEPPEES